MNKAKRILTHHRLANALYSTQPSPAHSIRKQVTHAPHFSTSLLVKNRSLIQFSSFSKGLFFSSKPESLIEILSSDDWPMKLEKELKDSNLALTHETVVYVLKKLSKAPKNASRFFKWAVGEKGFEPNSSIYSLVLRIYANKELMKEFWVTIKEKYFEAFL